jgi:hypothetical protein
MKAGARKRSLLMALAVLLTVGIPGRSAVAESGSGLGFGLRVAGSFLADLHLVGTDGTPFDIQALATLTADGGAMATDTDDYGFGTGSFFHSPKHGVWKRTGQRAVSITLLEFAYTAAGSLTTIFKLKFDGEFADRHFDVGEGTVAFEAFLPGQDPLDPEEEPVATGEGTFAVRRIRP